MSHDAAGATLMAIGSSSAELFIAIFALIKPGGHEEIGMGTIVGSALFNILVIIGVVAIVRKAKISWQPVVRDTIFYSISILILLVVFKDGIIELTEASLFVLIYIIYLVAVINWKKILPHSKKDYLEEIEEEMKDSQKSKWRKFTRPLDKLIDIFFPNPKKYYLSFFISVSMIAFFSWILVESAVRSSEILNVPSSIIALTVLAIGTSIPDTLSSVIVAKQGRGDMAISNAIGSNIFDILIGLGLPWSIALIIRNREIPVATENLYSSVILLFATVFVIFFLLLIKKWKIAKKSGYFLISLYLAYLIWAIFFA